MLICPRPEESSYSMLTRAHSQLANNTPAQSLRQITGIPGYKPMSGLPSRSEQIIDALRLPISIDSWIENHTQYPLFRPFLPAHRDEYVRLGIRGTGSTKSRLGLLRSHCGALEQLAYCERCVDQSVVQFGHAYWQRSHLTAGVLVCTAHNLPLSFVASSELPWRDRALVMPEGGSQKSLSVQQFDVLRFIAFQANAILTDKTQTKIQHQHYCDVLSSAGLVTQKGRLRGRRLKARIQRWLEPVRQIRPFTNLLEALRVERNWATIAVACEGGFTHPIKHIVIWGAIQCEWRDLVNAASTPGHQLEFSLVRPSVVEITDEELRDILERAKSVSAAAKLLKCDVTTAVVHAVRLGVEFTHRPKRITADVREKIVDDIRRNQKTSLIATKHKVSVTTVNRIRRSLPN